MLYFKWYYCAEIKRNVWLKNNTNNAVQKYVTSYDSLSVYFIKKCLLISPFLAKCSCTAITAILLYASNRVVFIHSKYVATFICAQSHCSFLKLVWIGCGCSGVPCTESGSEQRLLPFQRGSWSSCRVGCCLWFRTGGQTGKLTR